MTNEPQNNVVREGDGTVGTPYVVQCDPDDTESVLSTLICAVATVSERDPLDLPSLHQSIDPDALAVVLSSPSVRNLSFDYAGQTVTASGGGRLVVS